jgi:anti-sigma factor RsiW
MVTTCFFCQNLLSDYIEGILPSLRHEEIKKHLAQCSKCEQIHQQLIASVALLKELPWPRNSPELSLRIVEAAESRKYSAFHPLRMSGLKDNYWVPTVGVTLILIAIYSLFPRFSLFQSASEEKQFARYFPMSNGAAEILDEQAAWIQSKGSKSGSLWEEGGLSPDDFEKSFQKKGMSQEVTD